MALQIVQVSAADGYRFSVRRWPAQRPWMRLVMLHGIISHGGWYARTCAQWADAGIDVHFVDRRGAGLNFANRGDVPSFEVWCKDIEDYISSLPVDLPIALGGISWGGKLATAIATRARSELAGLLLLCPGLYSWAYPSQITRRLTTLGNYLGLSLKTVNVPLSEPRLFTAHAHWQTFIRTDPLTLRSITLRFAREDGRLTAVALAKPEAVHVPTLLMLAGQDRIVNNSQVRKFVNRVASPIREIREYPAAEHTLEFEPDRSRYMDEVMIWLQPLSALAAV